MVDQITQSFVEDIPSFEKEDVDFFVQLVK